MRDSSGPVLIRGLAASGERARRAIRSGRRRGRAARRTPIHYEQGEVSDGRRLAMTKRTKDVIRGSAEPASKAFQHPDKVARDHQ
jgi:hypothetical protein